MRALIALGLAVLLLGLGESRGGGLKKADVVKLSKTLQQSSSPRLRVDAAERLGRHGAVRASDVADAVDPLLVRMKKDTDPLVRKASAEALGRIQPDPKVVVPALVDALKDRSPVVRIAAAGALGALRQDAKEALPDLRELAKEKNKKVGQSARQAIKMITG